jgi:ABC-type glutathione transport system ATPase component
VIASVRLIEVPGQGGQRRAAAMCPAREETLLMDERSRRAATTPALLLADVVKTYGPVRAVDGVSFSAQPGEFLALLGPTEPANRRCFSCSPACSSRIPGASR